MSEGNGKKEKGLSDYGIIYLSGPIEDGTSESVCKEIIEYNISGKTDHIQMIINSSGRIMSGRIRNHRYHGMVPDSHFHHRDRDDRFHGPSGLHDRNKGQKGHYTSNFNAFPPVFLHDLGKPQPAPGNPEGAGSGT